MAFALCRKVVALLLPGVFVLSSQSAFAQCVLPYNLLNGTAADAPQMMANFNALLACLTPGGAANAIQYNSGSGVLGGVGPLANGELIIGSTGNPPQAQFLTAGSNVAITNAPGSISIAATNTTANAGLYRQVMSASFRYYQTFKRAMRGEVTFDLIMGDDMPFVEGCYRLADGIWHVFMFRKSRGLEKVGTKRDLVWKSGVTGLNVILADDVLLNKSVVLQTLSSILDVTEWIEVRGPDSMQLR